MNLSIENAGLVSIIIPVYRTESFLEECIRSLFHQTYSNIEIIAVDNGSDDACPEILSRLAQEDPRLRIITMSKNRGVYTARNMGLRNVAGQYIMFVDSDDYVTENYVERLLSLLLEYDAEIAQCCFYKLVNGVPQKYLSYEGTKVYTGRELSVLQASFVGLSTPQTVLWNKIYRRELFYELFFHAGAFEDMDISYRLLYPRKRVVWSDDHLYYWRIHANNSSIVYKEAASREATIYRERLTILRKDEDHELLALMMKRCYYVSCQHLYQLKKHNLLLPMQAYLRAMIREYFPELMKMPDFGPRSKLRFLFIRLFPRLFGGISLHRKLDFRI